MEYTDIEIVPLSTDPREFVLEAVKEACRDNLEFLARLRRGVEETTTRLAQLEAAQTRHERLPWLLRLVSGLFVPSQDHIDFLRRHRERRGREIQLTHLRLERLLQNAENLCRDDTGQEVDKAHISV